MACQRTYCPKVEIRKQAPAFTANAWDGNRIRQVSLSDYKGKYVVLFFYPLDFTFVCPTEICQFNDMAPEFRANNCEVLACSVDSVFTHREYTLKSRADGGLGRMQIPMIADLNKQIGKDYGCYLDHSGDEGVHLRATYIIDANGVVRHIAMNDLPVGRNVREILRLVQGYQYTDQYGEVCPESWTPGAATMVPDHESDKLQNFWQSQHGAKH